MSEERENTVIIAVDGSEHCKKAFDCKYDIFSFEKFAEYSMCSLEYIKIPCLESRDLSAFDFQSISLPGGIAGLQPIPRDSNDKDAAAMLGVQTIEAN